jgi:CRP-like cAMP-binding protein
VKQKRDRGSYVTSATAAGHTERRRVSALLRVRDYPKRATILREGEASDKLYLILDGSVSVTVEDEQDQATRWW